MRRDAADYAHVAKSKVLDGVMNAAPIGTVALQTCGREAEPLDEAQDVRRLDLLTTRTSGGSLGDIVSGCAPHDLDPTGGVDLPCRGVRTVPMMQGIVGLPAQ